jgi:hypothetical protein
VPQLIEHFLDFYGRSQVGVNQLYVTAYGSGHRFSRSLALVVMHYDIRAFRREA